MSFTFPWRGPLFLYIMVCFICPGEQDNNTLTGHQVFATRLTIALPFQEENEKENNAHLCCQGVDIDL